MNPAGPVTYTVTPEGTPARSSFPKAATTSPTSASSSIDTNAWAALPSSERIAGEVLPLTPSTELDAVNAFEIRARSPSLSFPLLTKTTIAGIAFESLNSPSRVCTLVASADAGR